MAKRPQRATRQTSQHPPARPAYAQRAAKVAAEDKLASSRRQAEFDDEDFDFEEAAPPRKDSRSTVTGKRKRVEFEDRGYGEEQRGSSEMDVDEAEGGGAHSVIDLDSEEGDGEGEVDEESEHEDTDKQEEEEGFEIQEREARIPRRDPDLEIADPGPRMKAGERTRFYAKVALPRVEVQRDPDGGKWPTLEEDEEDVRMPTHPPVILARVDLSILQLPGCGHTASELDLARFAMGARVLPLLKQWAFMWRNPDDKSNEFRQLLRGRFPSDKKPWNQEVSLVAQIATHEGKYGQAAELLHRMASFSRRLVNANNSRNDFDFFTRFSQQGWASDAPYKFAARLLLAVWEDIETNRKGFFGWLFHEQCELSRPNRPEVRHAYLGWYKLDESLYSSVPTPNLPAPSPAPIVMPVFIPAIQFPADTKPVESENKEGKAGGKKPVPAEKPYATGEI